MNCSILFLLVVSIQNVIVKGENDENGTPLILTPFIKNGSIELARNLSEVTIYGWSGHSGFLTVDEECGANIFFWFVLAKKNSAKCPTLVWLQGGPGGSSMYGHFDEIGPFNHFESGFELRNLTWANNNNLLFIDQPVGTGFSFPKNSCLADNMTVVIEDLHSTLLQFYKLFPELLSNKLYIAGQSFAGHYIPALCMLIHERNQIAGAQVRLNLAGSVIGNPLTRLACNNYSQFLWDLGIIGPKLRDEINQRHRQLELNVESGKYMAAYGDWYYILNSLIGEPTKFWNRYYVGPDIDDSSNYDMWLNTSEARLLLHVGDVEFTDPNWDVYNKLLEEIPKSYAPELAATLEANYTTWIYSGNLDLICLTTSTDCLLRGLDWWGAEGFLNANRTPWFNGGELAGYFEHYGPLTYVIFKDAGHSVPRYKLAQCYDMINSINFCNSSYPCHLNTTVPDDY